MPTNVYIIISSISLVFYPSVLSINAKDIMGNSNDNMRMLKLY